MDAAGCAATGVATAADSGAMFNSFRCVLSVVYTVPVTGVFCKFKPSFQFKTGAVGLVVLVVAGVAD